MFWYFTLRHWLKWQTVLRFASLSWDKGRCIVLVGPSALIASLAEPSRRGCGRITVLGCSGSARCGTGRNSEMCSQLCCIPPWAWRRGLGQAQPGKALPMNSCGNKCWTRKERGGCVLTFSCPQQMTLSEKAQKILSPSLLPGPAHSCMEVSWRTGSVDVHIPLWTYIRDAEQATWPMLAHTVHPGSEDRKWGKLLGASLQCHLSSALDILQGDRGP